MANLNIEVPVPPVREAPLAATHLENGRWAGYRQLVVSGLKILRREPEAIFWVFLFPVFLALGLGIASRNRPPEASRVAIASGSGVERALDLLKGAAEKGSVQARVLPAGDALNTGTTRRVRRACWLEWPWTTRCRPRLGGGTRC